MSKILKDVHEGAKDLLDAGLINKVTMTEFDALCLSPTKKLSARQIKKLRTDCKVSQPVFAKYLNVQPVTIKKWESGEKQPSGPALKLLNVIKNNGLDAITY